MPADVSKLPRSQCYHIIRLHLSLGNTNDTRDAINRLVDEMTAQHTLAEIMAVLEKTEVPGGPVNSIKDIFEDAHYWERETLVRVTDPVVGEVAMPGPIPHLSRTPGRIEWLGPARIGEHNQEVYGGMLGLSAAEIAQLQADGVI